MARNDNDLADADSFDDLDDLDDLDGGSRRRRPSVSVPGIVSAARACIYLQLCSPIILLVVAMATGGSDEDSDSTSASTTTTTIPDSVLAAEQSGGSGIIVFGLLVVAFVALVWVAARLRTLRTGSRSTAIGLEGAVAIGALVPAIQLEPFAIVNLALAIAAIGCLLAPTAREAFALGGAADVGDNRLDIRNVRT